jgi:HK97 family phage prohead protease
MSMVTDSPTLHFKNIPVAGVKVLDNEEGIVEAYVSGIGNKDSVGDIIEPGAFVASLKRRTPKGVWSHNWDIPVSRTLEIYEVAAGDSRLPIKMKTAGIGGLYVRTQFNLETQRGRDAFSDVKFFGEEAEWSIGYMVLDSEYDREAKATRLKEIELYEYSPVLFGANSLTSTVSVKVELRDGKDMEITVVGSDDTALKEKIDMAVKAVLEAEGKTQEDVESVEVTEVEPEVKDESAGTEESDPVGADDPQEDETEEEAPEDEASETEETPEVEEVEPEVEPVASEEDVKALATLMRGKNFTFQQAKEALALASNVSTKAVVGSFEERIRKIARALSESVEGYAYIYATFSDTIIYYEYNWKADYGGFFEVSYEFTDDGEVKFGDSNEVDVVEVVVAKRALMETFNKGYINDVSAWSINGDGSADFSNVEIRGGFKAGRVLSTKNRKKLSDAAQAIQDVLDADKAEEESDEKQYVETDAKELSETTETLDVVEDESDVETTEEVDSKTTENCVPIDIKTLAEFQMLAAEEFSM